MTWIAMLLAGGEGVRVQEAPLKAPTGRPGRDPKDGKVVYVVPKKKVGPRGGGFLWRAGLALLSAFGLHGLNLKVSS